MDKKQINYCFTNGYQDLSKFDNNEHDHDILFKKNDFFLIDEILRDFANQNDYKIVQCYHQGPFAKNFFIYDPNTDQILNLDLYGVLERKSIEFANEGEIFRRRVFRNGISTLAPDIEFIFYFVKKMEKRQLHKKTFDLLRELYSENENLCNAQIERHFRGSFGVIIAAFKNAHFKTLEQNQEKCLRDFESSRNTKLSLNEFPRLFKRATNPTGLIISFLGPDGAGKSTIISKLEDQILPFRRRSYFHLRPKLTKGERTVAPVLNPHNSPCYGAPKSILKLFYFVFIYNFGWIRNIFPLKIRSSLVIFDRFYDDIIADNKRYRYGANLIFAKFFKNFIPKPDICFILISDANVIYSRKQEIEYEELRRQIRAYRELAVDDSYHVIDANNSPEDITKEIKIIMMERMNDRYRV
ncbi:dTMP kinase [Thalassotalea litorea]|uniref:dTMP kinase n=1 Tax=Thalassotalea litorea TaxID=2020715 RepID=UPI001484CABB|nr:hypothetical protein [Thalassotalea litorea]